MKIDFLNSEHQEDPRTDISFGLCDDQNLTKAYSDTQNPQKWIAEVENKDALSVIFTPVDNAILSDSDLEGTGRCDGILRTEQHLYFVELKDMQKRCNPTAIKQLSDTIALFEQHHPGVVRSMKSKKAFVCNKAHPNFAVIDTAQRKAFYEKHQVRLDFNTKIKIEQ